MSRPEMYGPHVQIAVREDWIILQQKKGGVWIDLRFFDVINDEYAASDAREDAERLAAKCAGGLAPSLEGRGGAT